MVFFQSCWLFLVGELNFRCTLETKKDAKEQIQLVLHAFAFSSLLKPFPVYLD